ncbi:hypothetical protein SPRG_06981 [Saprolegnia parasitica CBS 223.65]|uniref:Micro-fibrillar-associated protein 1 C-terminal domain-containing protein n=1 Tax=Saprolegnia parasitica (strain CBS 223.65) TaxID=695850 RepID=A0A067C9E6_SAPPC|nr:hypothetical protein SPRG_06981 [Saprolegnia parasitica CBS 223.65]KDO27394.1 hypothetical protein SPRG_06981 [Saprolegnia parasitica CBS 223.65]|eukprot:XP_012201834.1 hypothetical protein SPRG_06981 [Saprolegnia parasitica CBS 223.65]
MNTFGKKDLGLLLPDDEPGDVISLKHTRVNEVTDTYEAPKPKLDTSKKVLRHRAGHVPEHALGELMEDEGRASDFLRRSTPARPAPKALQIAKPERRKIEATVVKAAAPRAAPSSTFQKAAPLLDSDSGESDVEDDRRARLRAKALAQQKAAPEANAIALPLPTGPRREVALDAHDTASEHESSSEWETDTDTSEDEQMLKPVFVPKAARDTIRAQEEKLALQEKKEEEKAAKMVERKSESRKLVAEVLQREQELTTDETTDIDDMPDDTDNVDPEKERQEWELREMRRLKRDKDERQEREREIAETLRRRNLTDEEREAEDRASGKLKDDEEKAKWKFMQKYYHKGAFYMDDKSLARDPSDVRKREADAPTLEDRHNYEVMPKVLQVKNFGKAGRTKYTHLVDQDTTDYLNPLKRTDQMNDKYTTKMAGMRAISRPTKKAKHD